MNDGVVKVNINHEDDDHVEKAIEDDGVKTTEGEPPPKKTLGKMSKSDLIERIEQLQEESKKNYDLYLRSEAESENIKKRNKKEKEEWVKYANESLIKEILPVLDNLENAISHSKNENSLHALREGVELTLKGLKDALMKLGLEEVDASGKAFDPSFHHAVSEQQDENVENGHIINELQRGYTFKQRLIRPAMVVVSKGKPGDTTNHDKPS